MNGPRLEESAQPKVHLPAFGRQPCKTESQGFRNVVCIKTKWTIKFYTDAHGGPCDPPHHLHPRIHIPARPFRSRHRSPTASPCPFLSVRRPRHHSRVRGDRDRQRLGRTRPSPATQGSLSRRKETQVPRGRRETRPFEPGCSLH